MKALVTGSSGFVGRHVAKELERRGNQVVWCDIATGWDAMDLFRQSTRQTVGEHFDLVVHAAASSPHRVAIDNEPMHLARNLQLDAALFDWAVRTGQGQVVYLSSSAAYPINLQRGIEATSFGQRSPRFVGASGPLREDDISPQATREPDSDYGWTKLTGERLAAAARRSGLAVTVVRPFSGYGEDQSEDFPFRALIERARRREDPFTIWGDGSQVRDWIHIDDVVAGMLAVADSGTDGPVNLCTGIGTSMVDLARMACAEVGYDPSVHFLINSHPGVAHRVGDPTALHQFYVPQMPLEQGVKRAFMTGDS